MTIQWCVGWRLVTLPIPLPGEHLTYSPPAAGSHQRLSVEKLFFNDSFCNPSLTPDSLSNFIEAAELRIGGQRHPEFL